VLDSAAARDLSEGAALGHSEAFHHVLLPADTCGTGCWSASRGPPDHHQDMSWVSS
jgi:hypothetical protein